MRYECAVEGVAVAVCALAEGGGVSNTRHVPEASMVDARRSFGQRMDKLHEQPHRSVHAWEVRAVAMSTMRLVEALIRDAGKDKVD